MFAEPVAFSTGVFSEHRSSQSVLDAEPGQFQQPKRPGGRGEETVSC